jgi:N-acetylglucosaminyl-diphospho-decaprenol L-rhamnosyltransferase
VQASEPPTAANPSQETSVRLSTIDLTAVVVDWNLPDHTIRCVRALVEDGIPASRVVVVENGPTEQTWQRVSAELAASVLIRLQQNVGYGAAANIGARALEGRAYLVANNDAFVHRRGTIGRMLEALAHDEVGVVVPRLLSADLSLQRTVLPFSTPLPALVRASGLSRFVPNRWQPRVSTHWDHSSSREIETAVGAVLLVEGRLWEHLAGFEQSAFMYAEEFDLCWRARELGRKTWFEADAEFVHLGGASTDRRWSDHDRSTEVASSEAAMIRRHLSPSRAKLTLAFMRAGVAARAVCFAAVGKSEAAESCRGFLAGLNQTRGLEIEPSAPSPSIEIVRPRG